MEPQLEKNGEGETSEAKHIFYSELEKERECGQVAFVSEKHYDHYDLQGYYTFFMVL